MSADGSGAKAVDVGSDGRPGAKKHNLRPGSDVGGYTFAPICIAADADSLRQEPTPHGMALAYILMKTKNLQQYLSQLENEALKAKLKEIQKNPQNSTMAATMQSLDDSALWIAMIIGLVPGLL